MPRRHSAEERSASFYRAGAPPEPPRGMSVPAREIWREIIASKPLDWFDADQLRSLVGHCENRARLNDLSMRLSKEEPGTKPFRELAIDMKLIATIVTSSARSLRLTVQNTADRGSTKNSERGSAKDELMGGLAVRRRAA